MPCLSPQSAHGRYVLMMIDDDDDDAPAHPCLRKVTLLRQDCREILLLIVWHVHYKINTDSGKLGLKAKIVHIT